MTIVLFRNLAQTLGDSFANQASYTGAVHPNKKGHTAYADILVRKATLDLNLPLEDPRIDDIDAVLELATTTSIEDDLADDEMNACVRRVIASLPGTDSAFQFSSSSDCAVPPAPLMALLSRRSSSAASRAPERARSF